MWVKDDQSDAPIFQQQLAQWLLDQCIFDLVMIPITRAWSYLRLIRIKRLIQYRSARAKKPRMGRLLLFRPEYHSVFGSAFRPPDYERNHPMRNLLGTVLPLLCLLNAAHARADETAARSRIVAVGLFKNGLAVIKREVTLGKAGTYVLDDVPEPVHGTYWIESVAPVESSVEMREVEVHVNELAPGNLQEDLAGKKVTIHFKGDKATPTNGTVAKLKTLKSEIARSRERILRYGDVPSVQPARFLVVQTAKGRSYIETSEIAYVESEGTEEKIMRRMPRLLLTVSETDKADSKVFVNYLTRGLSWAPSYRVDITDPKTLAVEQYAVVKNELADLDGTEIMLISGFPSVQFAHVTSPLASRTSLCSSSKNSTRATRPAPMWTSKRLSRAIPHPCWH